MPQGLQPLPTTTQPLPGVLGPINRNEGGFRDGHRRDHNRNNVIIYPYPVVVGGYSYYGFGYDTPAYPATPAPAYYAGPDTQANTTAPTVIVVAPPQTDGQTPLYYGPSTVVPQQQSTDQTGNVTTVGPAAEGSDPNAPAQTQLTLLVFKDHSIYAATDYWRQGDRIYYTTNYGTKNSMQLDQLDEDLTVQLNRERNVAFNLVERKP